MSDSPHDLADLYGRVEHALTQCGFLQKKPSRAKADWKKFADVLGEEFFANVRKAQIAETLLTTPPEVFANLGDKTDWEGVEPIGKVQMLFLNGVCQVRHNLIHGNKFIGSEKDRERDITLVREALAVLQLAVQNCPEIRAFLEKA
jgi:hypothetical protein